MPIQVPTRDEIRELMQAFWSARDTSIVLSRDSDIGIRIDMIVEAVYGLFVEIAAIQDDQFPSDKTSTEALEKHAEARFGAGARKGAIAAIGALALKVYGTSGSAIPQSSQLTFADGTQYEITSVGLAIPTSAPFEQTVDVQAIDKGTVGNRDVGETLSFSSPPAGITTVADIVVDIAGGTEVETDAELLARVQDAIKNPPAGGTFSDWRQWANAIEGVFKSFTYGASSVAAIGRRGIGFVDTVITVKGTGAARLPSAALIVKVWDALDDLRPATSRDHEVILQTELNEDIDIRVSMLPGFEYDWIKLSGALVSGWNPTTRVLTWDTAIDAGAVADVRLIVAGQLAVVDEVTGGSTMRLRPTDARAADGLDVFDTAPVATDTIYPAGPKTLEMQDAIKAYVDGLGPARTSPSGEAADPEQVDWDDELRTEQIERHALNVEGAKDCDLVTPASNVVPTDNGATIIQMITYGEVIVRPL